MRISNFSSMCHFFLISRGCARHFHLSSLFCFSIRFIYALEGHSTKLEFIFSTECTIGMVDSDLK